MMNKFYSSLIINVKRFPNTHQVFKPRYNKEYFKRLTARLDQLEQLIQLRGAQSDPNLSRENLELIKRYSPKLVSLKERYDKLANKKPDDERNEEETNALRELEANAAQIEDLIMPTVISIPNRVSKIVPPQDCVLDEVKSDFLQKQNLFKKLSHRKLSYINNCYSKSVVGPNSHYYHNIGAKLQHGLSDYFLTELEKEGFIPYSGLSLVKSAVVEASNSVDSRAYPTDPCRVLTDKVNLTTLHAAEASRESLVAFLSTLGHLNTNDPFRLVTNGAAYRPGSNWFDGDESRVTQFETVHGLVLNSSIESYSMKEYEYIRNTLWNLYKKLELPVRLVHCSIDSMFLHEYDAHRLDIWLPSQNDWIPVGRVSHYLDHISIRVGLKRGHLIDLCAFDGQALVAAIIENKQTATGKFIIPDVLQDHLIPLTGQELIDYTDSIRKNSKANDQQPKVPILQNYEQRRYFNKKKYLLGHSDKADRLFRRRHRFLDVRFCFGLMMAFAAMIDWTEFWRTYLSNPLRELLYDYVYRPVRRMWWSWIYETDDQRPEDLTWAQALEKHVEFYTSSSSALKKKTYYHVFPEEKEGVEYKIDKPEPEE